MFSLISGVAILCFSFPRRQAQILVQTVFMMLNVGKTIAPFIVTPFIAPDNNSTMMASLLPPSSSLIPLFSSSETHISIAYFIISGFSVLLSILNMVIFFLRGEKCFERKRTLTKQTKLVSQESLPSGRRVVMLLLMFLMMSLESGMESTEMSLLTSYFSVYLHYSKIVGVNAAAVYQGLKIFFSLIVIIVIKFIHPASLLLTDLSFILVGSIGMGAVVWYKASIAYLFVALGLVSAGFSNYLATQVTWLETRQEVTGRLAPVLSLALGLGGLALPPLTTEMLTKYGPLAYPALFVMVTVFCITLFFVTKLVLCESLCPGTAGLYQDLESEVIINCDSNCDNQSYPSVATSEGDENITDYPSVSSAVSAKSDFSKNVST